MQVLKNKILAAVGHTSAEGNKVADMLVAFSLHQVYTFVRSSTRFFFLGAPFEALDVGAYVAFLGGCRGRSHSLSLSHFFF